MRLVSLLTLICVFPSHTPSCQNPSPFSPMSTTRRLPRVCLLTCLPKVLAPVFPECGDSDVFPTLACGQWFTHLVHLFLQHTFSAAGSQPQGPTVGGCAEESPPGRAPVRRVSEDKRVRLNAGGPPNRDCLWGPYEHPAHRVCWRQGRTRLSGLSLIFDWRVTWGSVRVSGSQEQDVHPAVCVLLPGHAFDASSFSGQRGQTRVPQEAGAEEWTEASQEEIT